uniref:Cation-dependent mannose-6-phosphate receptor n=1 Tax=Sphenodon punctatus TaxID=8508 RepID=A0A8D0GNV5_SPHPU
MLSLRCTHAALLALVALLATAAVADTKGKNQCVINGKSKAEEELLKKLDPLVALNSALNYSAGEYTYTLKVCQEIDGDSAGLLQKKADKKTILGRINETQIFGGTDWIMLIYEGGEKYDSHCGKEKRRAYIMISCNRKTLANGFTIVTEERDKDQGCLYLFEMDSSLACPPEDTHLSIGSILLITFASLVAVYIIGGFLYQRLIVGAKGMEQFPHFAFWQDLGNLVADGCDFVCRSKPRNVPTAYRGVGDDQLGEEPEERDDHLLPM